MRSNLFAFMTCMLFSIALLSASVSALTLTSVSVPQNSEHGTDVTVKFLLNNTLQQNFSKLVWSESTISGASYKSLPTLSSINEREAKEVSFVVSIPARATGSISGVLKARNETTDSESGQLAFTIPIASTSTISLGTIKSLTDAQNGTLNVTNTGNTAINALNLSYSGNAVIEFSENNFALAPGSAKLVTLSLADRSSLQLGDNAITVVARDAVTNTQSSQSFTIRDSFCSTGARGGKISISSVDISNSDHDDDEWLPLDTITVAVDVENSGAEDIRDILVELGLFDSSGRNSIGKLDFEDQQDENKIEVDRINDDDEERVTFVFTIPGDLREGDYKLAVKAYTKNKENLVCADTSGDLSNTVFETIDVKREEEEGKFITFKDISTSPQKATCGGTVTLSTDVLNIGDEDQDRVKVTLTNKDLGVNLAEEIRGLDVGDDHSIVLNFVIPQNAADKSYSLDLKAEYDYHNGDYRQSLDDSKKIVLEVSGCQPKLEVKPLTLTAELESDAIPGKQMVVKTTIKNQGATPLTFVVNATGYSEWALLDKQSDKVVTLAPSESKSITFTLNVSKSAVGEQAFAIQTNTGSQSQSQEVAVTFPAQSKSVWSTLSENKLAWIIGLINLVLIIVIIVVAIRISAK